MTKRWLFAWISIFQKASHWLSEIFIESCLVTTTTMIFDIYCGPLFALQRCCWVPKGRFISFFSLLPARFRWITALDEWMDGRTVTFCSSDFTDNKWNQTKQPLNDNFLFIDVSIVIGDTISSQSTDTSERAKNDTRRRKIDDKLQRVTRARGDKPAYVQTGWESEYKWMVEAELFRWKIMVDA